MGNLAENRRWLEILIKLDGSLFISKFPHYENKNPQHHNRQLWNDVNWRNLYYLVTQLCSFTYSFLLYNKIFSLNVYQGNESILFCMIMMTKKKRSHTMRHRIIFHIWVKQKTWVMICESLYNNKTTKTGMLNEPLKRLAMFIL